MSDKQIKQLEEELEKTKQQVKEYLDGWQRAKADYINREREIERQRSEWLEFANVNLILEILPIAESFEQLLKYQNNKHANTETQNDKETQNNVQRFSAGGASSEIQWFRGLEQIKKQFDEFFKKLGVEKIKTIGEKFNPEFHEAVEKRGEGNEIIEEVSSGYKINGKVIKVAKVIIK